MIIYIDATKPVIKALVKYDMRNTSIDGDIASVNNGTVKIQGKLAKYINDFFGGCAFEIKTVKELNRILFK